MWMFPFSDSQEKEKIPFRSRMSLPAENAVILLGAGASASAGAPLMRGFIDRARDFLKLNLFDEKTVPHIKKVLEFYDSLHSHLAITEEDIDNVENLLSLAELTDIFPDLSIPFLQKGVSDSVRIFVESILEKAVRLPAPNSPNWLRLSTHPHSYLALALEHYQDRLTVITFNYDCVLEYACYCMGVPFTYNKKYGKGAEILKLHGSINWYVCHNTSCSSYNVPTINELKPKNVTGTEDVILEPVTRKCDLCESPTRPLIIPPTWSKRLESRILKDAWARAFEALSNAETLISIGYSLPISDPKVRELIHVGLSSTKLRQAMVAIGSDDEAYKRWNRLFRESWRLNRLEVRKETFEEIKDKSLFNALSIPTSLISAPYRLLPLSYGPWLHDELQKQLREKETSLGVKGVEWTNVAERLRRGLPSEHASIQKYEQILRELKLDWVAQEEFLPIHGKRFPA